jgi:hypothetical protein
MPASAAENEKLLSALRNRAITPSDRGDFLIYNLNEHGIDLKPAVETMIKELDEGHELRQRNEKLGKGTLARERFLGAFHNAAQQHYAIVTRGPSDVYLPATAEDLKDCRIGDPVLVDVKHERIVGHDGHAPLSGEVVSVEKIPADRPGHIIVRHRDELQLARLHHDLAEKPECCRPGAQVVYDPVTRFAVSAIDTSAEGSELLVDPESLERITREQVGAPNQVIDDIMDRIFAFVEYPDWCRRMRVRNRCSYLFTGPTGGGKSYHLKLLARLLHDLVEQLTGERSSRLVMVDASKFWASLFGATEQNITRFAQALSALGSKKLRGRDGRDLHVPLIVALEECEALLRARGESDASGHLFDRPLSLLLQKTDSLENALEVPIIWVATTNRVDLVDPAALRRMGMRQVVFGALKGHEALSVLKTKVPSDMPLSAVGDPAAVRERFFRSVVGYLYGPDPAQPLAEVQFTNSKRRTLHRADVVTPAILEEAVSYGVERSLRRSRRAGRLLGLDSGDVVKFLDRHFVNLAHTLRVHNVAEHCPEWFAREPLHVSHVVPLVDRQRRPLT